MRFRFIPMIAAAVDGAPGPDRWPARTMRVDYVATGTASEERRLGQFPSGA